MAIVELDREPRGRRPRGRDGGVIAALLAAASFFALAVWITRPAAAPATQRVADAQSVPGAQSLTLSRSDSTPVTWKMLGVNSRTLIFPQVMPDVDLAALPDRLANEAPPSTLRGVVSVRGHAGIASTEGPAVIWWTEGGTLYWLASPKYTIDELVKLADELRMPPSPDEWRR